MNIEKIFETLRNNTIYKFILFITGIQLSAHRYYLDYTLSLTVRCMLHSVQRAKNCIRSVSDQ